MVQTQLATETVHPDTQAVLLLCGVFVKEDGEAKPLNLREYNTLALWLGRQGRPDPAGAVPGCQQRIQSSLRQLGGHQRGAGSFLRTGTRAQPLSRPYNWGRSLGTLHA